MSTPGSFHPIRHVGVGILVLGMAVTTALFAQSYRPGSRAKDPGPRPNPPSAIPSPVPGLND